MPRNNSAIDDYSLTEFQELLADLRFTSVKTANLSTNVAVAFLTGIPHISRNNALPDSAPLMPDFPEQRGSVPTDVCGLDNEHYIELEDDRIERQIAADEGEYAKAAEGTKECNEEIVEFDTTTITSRLTRWCTKVSTVWERYREQNSDKLKSIKSQHSVLEEGDVKPKKKFYISYAELIIPSQDTYNPEFMNIPLHYGISKSRSSVVQTASSGARLVYDEEKGDHVEAEAGPMPDASRFADINTRFRLSNEWLHPTLSLTKLSRIKLTLFLAPRCVAFLDPSTVFSAWILFERLVIKGAVTKHNRKLYAATCLILAYKFNQDGEQVVINDILGYLCKDKTITARAIFAAEMKVFTLLEFSLKQSYSGMRKHLQHYLEFNRITFMDLYDTSESTYLKLENIAHR